MTTGVPQELPRHSVSVTGVVLRNSHVLAIRERRNGRWVPPGGVLELNEDPHDGVAREVLEETGVYVQAVKLTGVYKNMPLGVVSLTFLCRPLSGEPHPTDEAAEAAWITVDQARTHMVEARAIRVLDALCSDGPFVRTHDGKHLLTPTIEPAI